MKKKSKNVPSILAIVKVTYPLIVFLAVNFFRAQILSSPCDKNFNVKAIGEYIRSMLFFTVNNNTVLNVAIVRLISNKRLPVVG